LFRLLNETNTPVTLSPIAPAALAVLLREIKKNVINANTGKGVLAEMFRTGKSAEKIISEKGLAQISDTGIIHDLVAQVVRDNPDPLAQYLGGKESVFGFLVGQVMRASRGKANPQIVRELLRKRLDALREG
jgi:aspartyl-tRNA(Asn)/glutamyl-tRNA(Gln) amidotransferase subunit B